MVPPTSTSYPPGNLDELLDPLEQVVSLYLLEVHEQDIDSLRSSSGVDLSYAWNTGIGVVTPGLKIDWIHDFDNESDIDSSLLFNDPAGNDYTFTTRSPELDKDFALLGIGAVFTLPHNLSSYFLYEQYLKNDDIEMKSYNIGFGYFTKIDTVERYIL